MLEAFIRLLASLAVIIGVILVIGKFSRKRFAGNGRDVIRVLARQPLSRQSAVTVLRVGGQVLVVGTTESNMTLLTELDPDEIAHLDLEADATDSQESVASPIESEANKTAAFAAVGGLSGSLLSKQTWKQAWNVVRSARKPSRDRNISTPDATPTPAPVVETAPVDEVALGDDSFSTTPRPVIRRPHLEAPSPAFADALAAAAKVVAEAEARTAPAEETFVETGFVTVDPPKGDKTAEPAGTEAAPVEQPEPLATKSATKAEAPAAQADTAPAEPAEVDGPPTETDAPAASTPGTPTAVKKVASPARKTHAKKATPARRKPVITIPDDVTGIATVKTAAPAAKAPSDRKAPAKKATPARKTTAKKTAPTRRPAAKKTTARKDTP